MMLKNQLLLFIITIGIFTISVNSINDNNKNQIKIINSINNNKLIKENNNNNNNNNNHLIYYNDEEDDRLNLDNNEYNLNNDIDNNEDYLDFNNNNIIDNTENSNNINKNNNNNNLKFNKNNKFKIIQFTDLHFGEGENESWGIEQDINSTRVMNKIIDTEGQVDLVIFTGDLITGNNIIDNATKYWEKAVGVVKERGIPWAIAFGNHDDLASGSNGTRKDLMEFDISLGSYSKFGPKDIPGVSNYYLKIYDKDNKSPISMIWIFDSGDGEFNCSKRGTNSSDSSSSIGNVSSYKCNTYITKKQINWYSNKTEELKKSNQFNDVLWSGAFFHIPLQEYMLIWNYDTCRGYNNDSIACQKVNDGLLEEFVNIGDIDFITVGHNHGNDFCGTLDSIQMCYGRHTGYGGYGTWERGARVIELTLSKYSKSPKIHYNTWITFETGQQVFTQIEHRPNSTEIPQTKCT